MSGLRGSCPLCDGVCPIRTEDPPLTDCRAARPGGRFVAPPWTEESPQWQALDRRLPPGHEARTIAAYVDDLDLAELRAADRGSGSQADPPELMLKIALDEALEGHPAPAARARHLDDHIPLQWLARGIRPGRTAL